MILFSEGATKAQEDEAEGILAVLTSVYPNYPWAVRVYDGGFFIRHLEAPAGFGMNCKYKNVAYDAAVMKREIIMFAGEFLERCNLKRGRGNDDEIQYVHGVPEKYQPAAAKPKVAFENTIVDISGSPLRTTPRPQAING